ncbi:MAG: hypothetical protein WCY30_00030 [Candidatus Neomarinimicrobiota bacterium]
MKVEKRIYCHEYGKWSDPGFHAIIFVHEVRGDKINTIYSAIGSSWPNPYKPSNPSLKLDKAYAAIKSGTYRFRFRNDAHNSQPGFDLSVIDGEFNGDIPTISPNPNQNGQMHADHVDIHGGNKVDWEGSGACQTIDPYFWLEFISFFTQDETGLYILNRNIEVVS